MIIVFETEEEGLTPMNQKNFTTLRWAQVLLLLLKEQERRVHKELTKTMTEIEYQNLEFAKGMKILIQSAKKSELLAVEKNLEKEKLLSGVQLLNETKS